MKQILFDTNAILRFLLADIPEQHKKVENLVKLAKKGNLTIVVPEVVVFETYYSLRTFYDYSKETLIEVLESIISSNYFYIENSYEFSDALKFFKSTDLSLIDSYLLTRSKRTNIELFTFDKKLDKYAKQNI